MFAPRFWREMDGEMKDGFKGEKEDGKEESVELLFKMADTHKHTHKCFHLILIYTDIDKHTQRFSDMFFYFIS